MDHPIPRDRRERFAGMIDRNPYELLAALVFWPFVGVSLAVATFLPRFDPSPSFTHLPDWLCLVMAVPLLAASGLVVAALLRRWENLADRWRCERAGLKLGAAGWTAYAAVVLWYRPSSVLPAALAIYFVATSLARVRSSRRQENRIRSARGE